MIEYSEIKMFYLPAMKTLQMVCNKLIAPNFWEYHSILKIYFWECRANILL